MAPRKRARRIPPACSTGLALRLLSFGHKHKQSLQAHRRGLHPAAGPNAFGVLRRVQAHITHQSSGHLFFPQDRKARRRGAHLLRRARYAQIQPRHLLRRALGQQMAAVDHHGVIQRACNLVNQVCADQKGALRLPPVRRHDLVIKPFAHHRVQAEARLVKYGQLRPGGQARAQEQGRLHAAAVSLERLFQRQPKQRHQPSRLFFLPGRKQASAHGEKLGGISQASKVRRISDQAQAAQRFHPHRRAHQLGLPARLSQLAAYNAQQRAFSRAVSAQKAHHLARGHRKIQAVQRHSPTKAPCKATCADGRCSF